MVVSFDEPALAAWVKLQRCGGPPVQRRVPMATRAAMEAGESVYDAAPIANAHAVCQQQAALWHAPWRPLRGWGNRLIECATSEPARVS